MNNQRQLAVRPCSVGTVRDLLNKNKSAMMESLPKHIGVDRLIRIVMTQLTKNPRLQECTQGSLIGSILQCSLLGLEPDGTEGALIPFKNCGVMEATFQPMYQGLIKLAHYSDKVQVLYGEVVRENDEFEIERGLHPNLIHKPLLTGDRGKVIGAYAVFNLENGGADFEYLSMDDINKVKKSSKSAHKPDSPWRNWPEEMYKKTAIKRLCKRIPKSIELKNAVEIDNKVETGKNIAISGLFDEVGFEKPDDLAPEISAPQSTKYTDADSAESPNNITEPFPPNQGPPE